MAELRGTAAWELLRQESPDPDEIRGAMKFLSRPLDGEAKELLRKLTDKRADLP